MGEKLKLIYYVDPVCSTCWANAPYFRKLMLNYGHVLDIDVRLGGLLKSWKHYEHYNEDKITPTELIAHWDFTGASSGMSIDGDFWKESPLESSYPITFAYYAVKAIHPSKALRFLRVLQELTFLHKLDASSLIIQKKIAKHLRIDEKEFFSFLNSKECIDLFNTDVLFREENKIKHFPTVYLSNGKKTIIYHPHQKYSDWEKGIQKLCPGAKPKEYEKDIFQLLQTYPYMSTFEMSVLLDCKEEKLFKELKSLEKEKKVKGDWYKFGYFWRKPRKYIIDAKKIGETKEVTIIGGGIAGLCAAINFKERGIESVVFERKSKNNDNGLGFIIMENGLKVLDSMGLREEFIKRGKVISYFKLHDENGKKVKDQLIEPVLSIQRSECINILKERLGEENIIYNKSVKKFIKGISGKYNLVEFGDGSIVASNSILAADGTNSLARKTLYPHQKLTKIQECEIVGITNNKVLNETLRNGFFKLVNKKKGLNMGMLPCGNDRVIWFIQIDTNKNERPSRDEDIHTVAANLTDAFPAMFKRAIASTSPEDVYLWNIQDLPLIKSFEKDGLFLLGDAAHPLLSFTSQGVSMALEDGLLLSEFEELGTKNCNSKKIGNEYYKIRKNSIIECKKEGQRLLNEFLYPTDKNEVSIPLVCTIRK